jgi:hypothetical protein
VKQRLKQVRRGKKYLRHPSLVRSVYSDSEGEDYDAPIQERPRSDAASKERSPFPMKVSNSMPDISQSRRGSASRGGQQLLPPIATAQAASDRLSSKTHDDRPTSARSGRSPSRNVPTKETDEEKEIKSLFSGFWTETKLWNISITMKGQMKGVAVRRHHLGLPGGAVVMANGRIPVFSGRQQVNPCHFYSFKILSIDDVNYPLDKCRDLTIAFGVSKLQPNHECCPGSKRINYAYEIPSTWLVGYGKNAINDGKWAKFPAWSAKNLEVDDVVGVMITMKEQDLVVFVNGEQVIRLKTTIGDSETKSSKLKLFPIIDLHGRVSSVQLLKGVAPPNVQLEACVKMK